MCLNASAFADCCGITIFNGFTHRTATSQTDSTYGPKDSELLNYLKDKHRMSRVGLHLIALNHYQVKRYGELVLKAGYKVLVDSFYHPGHGHTITLYGQVQHGEGEKPDTPPMKTDKSIFGKAFNKGATLLW